MTLPVLPGNLPQIQLSPDLVARAQSMLQEAAQNLSSAPPRLSFGGKMFNLTSNGATVELQDRVLDVHIVAIDSRHHYVFYERAYEGVDGDSGKSMARYPVPEDTIEYTPTKEWAQRTYRHRCVVMLANDPNHNLYVVDFGYNSCKKTGNINLGLMNLGQLVTLLNSYAKQNAALLPFLFTVQLSFTKETVPEVQFSLFDQRAPQSHEVRFASPGAINAMQTAFTDGTIDNLMKVEYSSAAQSSQPALAAPAAPQAPQIPQQPAVQTAVQPAAQPAVQPAAQPAVQPQSQSQPATQPQVQGGAFVGIQAL